MARGRLQWELPAMEVTCNGSTLHTGGFLFTVEAFTSKHFQV